MQNLLNFELNLKISFHNSIFKILFSILIAFSNSANLNADSVYSKVIADNWLNLRERPEQNSSIIVLLPKGTRVELLEQSDKTEVINGKAGKWVEVEWLGNRGWVFDAYLEKVNEEDQLAGYLRYLKTLKKGELSSIKKAEEKFLSAFDTNSKDAENAFRSFTFFLNMQKEEINPKLNEKLQLDYGQYNTKLVNELKYSGLTVEYCEGESSLVEYYDYYAGILSKYSFEFKEYLLLLSKVGDPYTCDGGIGISWEEMRKRISLIEKFIKNHETIPDRKRAEEFRRAYMNDYANGLDNTPVCDFRNQTLLPEVRSSFKKFLTDNKSSFYFPFMEKLYSMYEKNNFKCSREIKNYSFTFFYPEDKK
ncbi:SH3 domain protein [Leptospira fainei serovar Hurstbridge str. BUT 6]|uniref:SH3 domain protein n=1 Tax=Leptospira fainei serovar Hurstbridge str. BUT 6 TaxID=1193011 RepID=S3UX35_9LEPT|nr:SH3 domain-containing protein [Leptospira fainei]EPG74946.1 SH3 domain protein [Leptospira fainei serovar Hurstbridge str. BUT 6]